VKVRTRREIAFLGERVTVPAVMGTIVIVIGTGISRS
jgi:hypothetical protein